MTGIPLVAARPARAADSVPADPVRQLRAGSAAAQPRSDSAHWRASARTSGRRRGRRASSSAAGQGALAAQQELVGHLLPEGDPQREPGHGQQGGSAECIAERVGELGVGDRMAVPSR